MCGGIAGALAVRSQQSGTGAGAGARIGMALAYNLARITSYAVAGGIAGLLGRTLLHTVDVKPLSIAFECSRA
jgi:sulfite exporter TauE/SafE